MFLLTVCVAYSQVKVLPPALFLDNVSKSGVVVLQNGGNVAREVTTEFENGYVMHNENGSPFVYDEDKGDKGYSLEPYIKAFPKKVVLPPFGSQSVRFLVKTPPKMKDGTYWVRLVTTAKEPAKLIDTVGEQRVGVYYQMIPAVNTIIIFRKGKCIQDVNILSHSFDVSRESVFLNMAFNRGSGNSPFWGTIYIDIYDDSGNKVESKETLMIVYFEDTMKIDFDRSKFKTGKYKAEIRITEERKTVPKDKLLRFNSMEETYYFTVP